VASASQPRQQPLVHVRQGAAPAVSSNDTTATFHVTDSPAARFQPDALRAFRRGYGRRSDAGTYNGSGNPHAS
jgi:hypothetical protein